MKQVITIFRRILESTRQISHWLSENGYNNYDLSVADEIMAFYAVITLYVSYVDWIQRHPVIIETIIISVSVNIVLVIIALNQKDFWTRIVFYTLAVLSSVIGTELILEASGHDLSPQRGELNSILIGILVWIGIRETATFTMNLISKMRPRN